MAYIPTHYHWNQPFMRVNIQSSHGSYGYLFLTPRSMEWFMGLRGSPNFKSYLYIPKFNHILFPKYFQIPGNTPYVFSKNSEILNLSRYFEGKSWILKPCDVWRPWMNPPPSELLLSRFSGFPVARGIWTSSLELSLHKYCNISQ